MQQGSLNTNANHMAYPELVMQLDQSFVADDKQDK